MEEQQCVYDNALCKHAAEYDERLFAHEDKTYCIYHLPLEKQREVISSPLESNKYNRQLLNRYIQEQTARVNNNEIEFIDFSHAVFPSHTDIGVLLNALRQAPTHFHDCVFNCGIKYSAGTPIKNVEFCRSVFLQGVSISKQKFSENVDFSDVQFHSHAEFSNTEFRGKCYFSGCKYYGILRFSGVRFYENAQFQKTNIWEKMPKDASPQLILNNVVNYKKLNFSESKFWTEIKITDPKFQGGIDFSDTEFLCNTQQNFSDWDIPKNTSFEDAHFHGYVNFSSKDHDINKCNFDNAKFYKDVSFQNRKFVEKCTFNNTIFVKAPDFSGSTVHKGINLRHAIFEDKSTDAYDDYIALKNLMQDIGKKEDYLHFFKLAQECKHSNKKLHPFDWYYKYMSDYGTDYVTPMVWMYFYIVIMIYMTTICSLIFMDNFQPAIAIVDSANFILSQTFYPITIWKFDGTCAENTHNFLCLFAQRPDWLLLIRLLWALVFIPFTASLTAFFFLGLNWHFKKKMD